MQVYSFFEQSYGLKPTKVEISLIPGLPDFKVTGLPDSSMKESLLRIKSALIMQGYELPKTHQVMINLTPAFEKKKSKGLELAIACAYLWHTEQAPKFKDKIYVYGELGLSGQVKYLPELNWLDEREEVEVLTGEANDFAHDCWELKSLKDLELPTYKNFQPPKINIQERRFSNRKWSNKVGEAMAAIALGQHHSLVAGPAGSGKSTFNDSLINVLPPPTDEELFELRRWNRVFDFKDINERPFRQPHHTSTVQAVLGGGRPIVPGEVTRAHKGLLVLDEFLEFSNHVREALREPMQTGEIHLARNGHVETLPADFLLIASTNLCPCGSFVPKDMTVKCRFSLRKCNSYLERLSGPIADRFDVLLFSNTWGHSEDISEGQIFARVQKAFEFQQKQKRHKTNGRMAYNELLSGLKASHLEDFLPTQGKSRRRNQSVLRVARSFADLDLSVEIQMPHLRKAIDIAWKPFQALSEPLL